MDKKRVWKPKQPHYKGESDQDPISGQRLWPNLAEEMKEDSTENIEKEERMEERERETQ